MALNRIIHIPDLGDIGSESGFELLSKTSDGRFATGKNGVVDIVATGDKKVEFISFGDSSLACVKSSIAFPVYYPVLPVKTEYPIKTVLMDLDGTTVRSEEFWIWIIQMSVASLLGNPKFELEESDMPYVSGHSVSEHLQYCIEKYCPEKPLDEARNFYFEHTHREMEEIMAGRGREGAFTPTVGVKDFLYSLKDMGIKIGLVTSGLYEKAWPEILSAFKTLGMGD
ncbi:MAG: HAD hydrolase-like protein, partial [Oscillospiraceae bacterium]